MHSVICVTLRNYKIYVKDFKCRFHVVHNCLFAASKQTSFHTCKTAFPLLFFLNSSNYENRKPPAHSSCTSSASTKSTALSKFKIKESQTCARTQFSGQLLEHICFFLCCTCCNLCGQIDLSDCERPLIGQLPCF